MNRRRIGWKEVLVFVLICILFFIGQLNNIQRMGDNLPSYDPYYHKKIVDLTISEHKMIQDIPNVASPARVTYTTLLYPLFSVISIVAGISSLDIFRIFGAILLFFTSLIVFLIVRKETKRNLFGYVAVLVFLSSNYLLTRMSMSLPENFALFILSVILYFLLYYQRGELFVLFFSIYLFYHQRSFVIPLFVALIFLFVNYRSIRKQGIAFFKKTSAILIAIIVISLPILIELSISYLFLFRGIIGIETPWEQLAQNSTFYEPFSFNDFVLNLSVIFPVLFFVGLMTLTKKRFPKSNTLWIMAVLTITLVIASMSHFITSSVPSNRFVVYITLFFSVFFGIISSFMIKDKKRIFMLLIFFITVTTVSNLFIEHGWSGFAESDRKAVQFITGNYTSPIVLNYGSSYYPFMNNVEIDPLFTSVIFRTTNRGEVLNLLRERYGSKDIVMVISASGFNSLIRDNNQFYNMMDNDLVFEDGSTRVYYIDLRQELI
jgi:hypothetical protein